MPDFENASSLVTAPRKAVEADLAHFAALVSSSSDAIISESLDAVILSWNRGATALFGYCADEMIGGKIDRLIPPEIIDEERRVLARLRRGRRIEHFETVWVAKDGRKIDASLMISPVNDAAGNVVAISMIIRDIGDRKRAETSLRRSEKALRQSQNRLRHAADAGRLTHADIDMKRRRLRVSENFEHVMGYMPPRNAERASFAKAIPCLLAHVTLADRWKILAAIEDISSGKLEGAVEFREIGDDGAVRWIEARWNVEAGRDGKPTRAFITGHDVTSLVESRNAIAAAKAEAEHASEMKSKFLAAASHDLRQPVQSLILLIAALEKQAVNTVSIANTVAMMKLAVDGLRSLLTGILDISRLDAGAMAPINESVDLGALVNRLAAEYQTAAAAKGLEFRRFDGRCWAWTDPNLLERALRNLIENALRYTIKGGVLLGLRCRGRRIRIVVVDTGVGIAAGKLSAIFEEFYQVGNPGRDLESGLGLGLAIVVRLAELLGAEVGVTSKLGRGSCFSLSLPLDRERSTLAAAS